MSAQLLRKSKTKIETGNFIIGILTICTLGFLPVYIFPSGSFQPVDLFIVLTFLYAIFIKDNNKSIMKNAILLLPFLIWCFIVNIGYFMIFPKNLSYLKAIAFISQGFIILFTFLKVINKFIKNNDLKYIYIGLILSVILCLFFKGDYEEGTRNALSFNNPNQLGYFAIVLLSFLIILLNYRIKKGIDNVVFQVFDIIIILASHLFAFFSLSRSTIALLILDFWLLKNIKNKAIVISLVISGFLGALFVFIINPNFIEKQLQGRPKESYKMQSPSTVMEERLLNQFKGFGGFRILVGNGGMGGDAFQDPKKISQYSRLEVHNLFGNTFKVYGLIGLILFMIWLTYLIIATKSSNVYIYVWLAILLYNMTHYGLRFRAFWILIALMLVTIQYLKKDEKIVQTYQLQRAYSATK